MTTPMTIAERIANDPTLPGRVLQLRLAPAEWRRLIEYNVAHFIADNIIKAGLDLAGRRAELELVPDTVRRAVEANLVRYFSGRAELRARDRAHAPGAVDFTGEL